MSTGSFACQDEPPHTVTDPRHAFGRSVPDATVAGDDDEAVRPDDRQPLVVERSSRNLWNVRVPGIDDAVVQLGESLAQRQVVLVDEERPDHCSRRQ